MTWDVVIVGGGSAGSVLAARLSADPDRTVLLLEAGRDVRPAEEGAALRGLNPFVLLTRPEHAGYRYDDIAARRTAVQDPTPYQRGRGLGGSTLVNGHLAIRGEFPQEYADWGLPGWTPADVLPAFVALETDTDFGLDPGHGAGGPLPISRAPREQWSRLDNAFCDAALAAGHPWSPDHNAPGTTGVSPYASILRDGQRWTAGEAYLDPVRHRANLEIRTGVVVDRVVVEGGRVVGVRTAQGEDVPAAEVVLAAGAVASPAILMRSGVGPAAHLRDLGIDLLRDAPVGANLQDHSAVWLGVLADPRDGGRPEPRFANCCVRYSSGLAGAGRNDMFLSCVNLTAVAELGLAGMVNVCTYQAFSRGELRLVSRDPQAGPAMDMRMLSDRRDVVRLRDGLRRLWALVRSAEMAPAVTGVKVAATGEPLTALPTDDDELDRFMMRVCQDAAHAGGTCRMGPAGDPRSVVDPECSVIGLRGLRVVDASVFPEIPRANTQVPTLMIAERMARLMSQRPARAGASSVRR